MRRKNWTKKKSVFYGSTKLKKISINNIYTLLNRRLFKRFFKKKYIKIRRLERNHHNRKYVTCYSNYKLYLNSLRSVHRDYLFKYNYQSHHVMKYNLVFEPNYLFHRQFFSVSTRFYNFLADNNLKGFFLHNFLLKKHQTFFKNLKDNDNIHGFNYYVLDYNKENYLYISKLLTEKDYKPVASIKHFNENYFFLNYLNNQFQLNFNLHIFMLNAVEIYKILILLNLNFYSVN